MVAPRACAATRRLPGIPVESSRIQAAAEKGYAVVANETVLGDISVAAPVIGRRGEAVGAINISVPTTRWTREEAEAKLAAHVHVAAASISQSKFGDCGSA